MKFMKFPLLSFVLRGARSNDVSLATATSPFSHMLNVGNAVLSHPSPKRKSVTVLLGGCHGLNRKSTKQNNLLVFNLLASL